jgi:hypothetical protein
MALDSFKNFFKKYYFSLFHLQYRLLVNMQFVSFSVVLWFFGQYGFVGGSLEALGNSKKSPKNGHRGARKGASKRA